MTLANRGGHPVKTMPVPVHSGGYNKTGRRLWVTPGKTRAEHNESALPRAADIRADVAQGLRRATFGLMHRSENAPSFDDLVGAGEEHRRNGEAKRLRGLEIDH